MKNIYQNYKKSVITAIVLTCIIICYTFFGFFGVPWILKDVVPKFVVDKNATLVIKEAKFNPYKFELNATGISLSTYSEIFSADAIDLELKFRDIFKGNINVEVLRLIKPFVNIEREKDLSFNFTPLTVSDSNTTESRQDSSESFFNFILGSFKIVNGGASYADNSLNRPFKVSFKDLSYEINSINLKEYSVGKHKLDTNSTLLENFDWNGKVELNPLTIYGDVRLSALKLDKIWQSYMSDSDLNITRGFLDLGLRYNVNIGGSGIALEILDSNVTARELLVHNRTNAILLNKAGINGININLFSDGNVSSKGDIKSINLDRFDLNSSLKFGLKNADIKNINYNLNNTLNSKFDELSLQNLSVKQDENLVNLSTLNIINPNLNVDLNTSDMLLNIPKIITAGVSLNTGKEKFINLNGIEADEIKFDSKIANASGVKLDKLDVFSNEKVFAGFKDIFLSEFSFDVIKTALNLENIRINSPFFNSKIDKKGSSEVNNLAILKMQKTTKTTAKPVKKTETNSTQNNFVANVKNLEIIDATSTITQNFTGKPLKHNIKLNSNITDLSSEFKKPFNLVANISTSEKISVDVNGKVAIEPLKVELDVKVLASDLTKFNKILSNYLNGEISSGKVDFNGKLKFNKYISAIDGAVLSNFGLNDNNKSLVASVKSLNLKKINYSPSGLLLENVELNSPYVRVKVAKDKSLNLVKLVKDSNTTELETEKSKTKTKKKDEFDFRVKNFVLNNANVDFSDASLVMPFLLKIKKLNAKVDNIQTGSISEISSNGVVGDGGSANISMRLNAFDPKSFSDISLKFKDIELNEVTPYSATFVGRKIDSGTLDLSLVYKIENSQMNGENDVKIDTIKLGQNVESPDAMSLPLSLAISILQDSNNVISLNLPVSGDISDPQFSYGGIVFKAIMQIFTDVVTSPFRLLGNVLGIANSAELASIDFTAGDDEVMSSQAKKIGEFKKITDTKSDVVIVITPAYDGVVDKFAVQKRLFDRDVAITANKTGSNQSDVINALAKKAFKTMPSDPYKALIEAVKFSPTALDELAKSRAESLKKSDDRRWYT